MHLYRLGELTLYSLTDIRVSVFLLIDSTVCIRDNYRLKSIKSRDRL